MLFAKYPQNRADAYMKIISDPAQPHALGGSRPDRGNLGGIGLLKTLAAKRSSL
jgi:hypothetical protein